MPVYQLINPSDPYTMRARDHQTAVIALLFLSHWHIGGEPIDPPEPEGLHTPFYPFGLSDDALGPELDRQGIPEGLNAWMGSQENLHALADALDSVLYGHSNDRSLFEAAVEAITDPSMAAALKAKHQDQRSSMNDIGGRAVRLADTFRAEAAELTTSQA
jgi:hypothetical protein